MVFQTMGIMKVLIIQLNGYLFNGIIILQDGMVVFLSVEIIQIVMILAIVIYMITQCGMYHVVI